jgi:hypothetical protein
LKCGRKKREVGRSMLEMVSGALVALCFLGLPLAIIGLFIASTLDRRNARAPQGFYCVTAGLGFGFYDEPR